MITNHFKKKHIIGIPLTNRKYINDYEKPKLHALDAYCKKNNAKIYIKYITSGVPLKFCENPLSGP